MSHNFPQNRDDIGVKIFPHDDLIKRGNPEYYHYTPSDAEYGDKFQKKTASPGSGISPKVEVRRSDFNQQSPSQLSARNSSGHSGYEVSTEHSVQHANKPVERKLELNAIKEHLQHHDRLEKLDDFNVDVTPSPLVHEQSPFAKPTVHDRSFVHQEQEEHHQQEHVSDFERELEKLEHVNQHEYTNLQQPVVHAPHPDTYGNEREDYGYETVSERHEYEPKLEIQDNLLQKILHHEYGDEFASREVDHVEQKKDHNEEHKGNQSVLNKVEEYEQEHRGDHEHQDDRSTQHHVESRDDHEHKDGHSTQHHVESHKVTFDEERPRVREITERIEQNVYEEPAVRHQEKFGVANETREYRDQHTTEHRQEPHQPTFATVSVQQHAPVEHRTENVQLRAPPPEHRVETTQQHAPAEHRFTQHDVSYGVDTHQRAHDEEEPKEHDMELNSVKQMVKEHELKTHKDGHSPEHHVQHHKAKQMTQTSQYQPRETTMELLHEHHEVRLNIEVKHQAAAHVEPVHQEPRTIYKEMQSDSTPSRRVEQQYVETKQDITPRQQYVETKQDISPRQQYVETKQDLSPSRRVEQQYPDVDSPTRLKTDQIIAQLKAVGVDSSGSGVKTLKDLKEEKKIMQTRKEEEIKDEIARIKREYTAEKFMTDSPTHGGKTGFELPEWKRKQIAQKKAEEAAKAEEERLWKEFDAWKQGQSPSWIKDVKQRKSQP